MTSREPISVPLLDHGTNSNGRHVKMKIGILGVGSIGSTLARKWSAAGHEVSVANSRGPAAVRAFAEEIGAAAVDARGAVEGAEVVVISIPLPVVAALPSDLFDGVPIDVPVVDTGNYYPGWRDPQIPEIDEGQVESVWVAKQIGRPVIKAFNNILAGTLAELGRPEGSAERLAVAVAGDDAEAKKIVMGLVNETGFDPVDAGALEESWRIQPSTPGYCCDYDADRMRRGVASAVRGAAPSRRDRQVARILSYGRPLTRAELLAMNRELNPVD